MWSSKNIDVKQWLLKKLESNATKSSIAPELIREENFEVFEEVLKGLNPEKTAFLLELLPYSFWDKYGYPEKKLKRLSMGQWMLLLYQKYKEVVSLLEKEGKKLPVFEENFSLETLKESSVKQEKKRLMEQKGLWLNKIDAIPPGEEKWGDLLKEKKRCFSDSSHLDFVLFDLLEQKKDAGASKVFSLVLGTLDDVRLSSYNASHWINVFEHTQEFNSAIVAVGLGELLPKKELAELCQTEQALTDWIVSGKMERVSREETLQMIKNARPTLETCLGWIMDEGVHYEVSFALAMYILQNKGMIEKNPELQFSLKVMTSLLDNSAIGRISPAESQKLREIFQKTPSVENVVLGKNKEIANLSSSARWKIWENNRNTLMRENKTNWIAVLSPEIIVKDIMGGFGVLQFHPLLVQNRLKKCSDLEIKTVLAENFKKDDISYNSAPKFLMDRLSTAEDFKIFKNTKKYFAQYQGWKKLDLRNDMDFWRSCWNEITVKAIPKENWENWEFIEVFLEQIKKRMVDKKWDFPEKVKALCSLLDYDESLLRHHLENEFLKEKVMKIGSEKRKVRL